MNPVLLTLGDSIDKIFYGFDMAIFEFFGSIQNTFFTYLAKFFTTFGDEAFTIPIVILAVVLCFFKKTRKYGFTLLFAIAVGTIITNVIVKPTVLRIHTQPLLLKRQWRFSSALGRIKRKLPGYSRL